MSISKSKFGVTKEGKEVTKYTLKNTNGLEVSFIDLGGVITNIMMPDKDGNVDDIVLGYDKVSDYEVNMPSFGAPIGRYANRVSNASFSLNGKEYKLDMNDNTNALLLKRHAMLSVANIMQALIKNTSGLVNANTSACTRECLAAVSIIKFMRSAITAVTVRLLTYFFCASLRYMSFILFILSTP